MANNSFLVTEYADRGFTPKGLFKNYYSEKTTDENGQEDTTDVGFIGGLKHSPIANLYKESQITKGDAPQQLYNEEGAIEDTKEPSFGFTQSNQYQPSQEVILDVYKKCNYDETSAQHILREATSDEDIEPLINLYKENKAYQEAEAKAGVLSSISSSFGKSLGNPVDLATMGIGVGATPLKAVATGASLSFASTATEEYATGIEQDVTGATVAGGAMLGAIASVIPFAKGFSRVASDDALLTTYKTDRVSNAIFKGGQVTGKFIHDSTPVVVRNYLSEQKQRFYNWLPSLSLEGARDSVIKTQAGRDFMDKLFYSQKGRLDATGNYVQAPKGKLLGEDLINRDNIEIRAVQDSLQSVCRQLKANGLDYEDLRDVLYRALEGNLEGDSAYSKLKGFSELVSSSRNYLNKQFTRLQNSNITTKSFDKNYVPAMFSNSRIIKAMQKYFEGKSWQEARNGMIEKVKTCLIMSADNPQVRKRLADYYTKTTGKKIESSADNVAFNTWLKKQAGKDATGYVDQSKSLLDSKGKDETFVPEYTHDRTPWDFSYTDSSGFSVNSLRLDPLQCLGAYGRRVTGDLISTELYGIKTASMRDLAEEEGAEGLSQLTIKGELTKRAKELAKEEAKSVSPALRDSQEKASLRAFDSAIRAIYRTSDTDFDANTGWMSAISDCLRNISFMSANGYMGLLNLTEQAEAIKAYGATFMLRSLPGISKRFSSWSKGQFTPDERRDMLNMVFGYDVRPYRIWDETYQRTAFKYGEGSVKSLLVAGTAQVAEWMPTSRFLNATQESISKTAQDMFLGELLHHVHDSPKVTKLKVIADNREGFLSKETLKRAGVTKPDFDYLQGVLKKAFSPNKDGYFDVTDIKTLMNNDRALYTLRRLGNYVSSECIQKNSIGNTMLWQGSKASPIMGMLFQFKTFALASYNNRLLKSLNRIKEGDIVGQAQTHVLGIALAGMGVLAQASLKTAGMSDKEREQWMERNYGIKSIDETDLGTAFKFFLNSSLRTGLYASVSLPISMVYNPQVKSTTTAWNANRDKPTVQEFVADQFPAVRTANSILGLGYDLGRAVKWSLEEPSDDYSSKQIRKNKEKASKAFVRDILNISPSIDVLKNITKGIAYDAIEE